MVIRHQKIQIIGVPLDLGASRRGTDGAPSALRIAGLGAGLRGLGYELSIEQDIAVPSKESRAEVPQEPPYKQEILAVCQQLATMTRQALQQHQFPLVLGGDHSIAMGSVTGSASLFQSQQQQIGLIWLDAHGDMNTPQTSPSGNIHGMPLAHLLGYGDRELAGLGGFRHKVKAENVVLIGIREIDASERALIHRSGINCFTMRDIDELGMAEVSRRALQIVTTDTAGFHLSFDVDACDPTVIPGCGTLVSGGISYREAHLLFEYCADSGEMVSMDVVELNPFLDQANISAQRTVSLIQSALGRRIL